MLTKCAHCGHSVDIPPVAQPEPNGPPDFDTRPAEPLRSTLLYWVEFCPECFYASDDISTCTSEAKQIIESPEYAAIVEDETRPDPAQPFLLYAHLLDRMHQHADAGWSCLHAAWVCDDVKEAVAAALSRAQAIELWQKGKRVGQSFGDDIASEFALVIDLYRRMGQFEHAAVTCGEALDIEDLPPILERLLRRQMVLIQSHDNTVHNMSELLY